MKKAKPFNNLFLGKTIQNEKGYMNSGYPSEGKVNPQQDSPILNHPQKNQIYQSQDFNQSAQNNFNHHYQQATLDQNRPNTQPNAQAYVHNLPNLAPNVDKYPNQSNNIEHSPNSQIRDTKNILGFTILGNLGSGFSANVFLVQKGNDKYALKEYNIKDEGFTTKSELLQNLFEREINLVQKMDHLNIVKYFLANKEKHIILMEYMEGNLISVEHYKNI